MAMRSCEGTCIEWRLSAATARLNSSGRMLPGTLGAALATTGAGGIGCTGAGTGTGSGAAAMLMVRVAQAETTAPLAMTSADLISARRVCAEFGFSITLYPLTRFLCPECISELLSYGMNIGAGACDSPHPVPASPS